MLFLSTILLCCCLRRLFIVSCGCRQSRPPSSPPPLPLLLLLLLRWFVYCVRGSLNVSLFLLVNIYPCGRVCVWERVSAKTLYIIRASIAAAVVAATVATVEAVAATTADWHYCTRCNFIYVIASYATSAINVLAKLRRRKKTSFVVWAVSTCIIFIGLLFGRLCETMLLPAKRCNVLRKLTQCFVAKCENKSHVASLSAIKLRLNSLFSFFALAYSSPESKTVVISDSVLCSHSSSRQSTCAIQNQSMRQWNLIWILFLRTVFVVIQCVNRDAAHVPDEHGRWHQKH